MNRFMYSEVKGTTPDWRHLTSYGVVIGGHDSAFELVPWHMVHNLTFTEDDLDAKRQLGMEPTGSPDMVSVDSVVQELQNILTYKQNEVARRLIVSFGYSPIDAHLLVISFLDGIDWHDHGTHDIALDLSSNDAKKKVV